MAQINAIKGSSCSLLYDASVIGTAKDFTLTVDKNEIDITSLGSNGWKEIMTDMKSWSVDLNGFCVLLDTSAGYGYQRLLEDLKVRDSSVTVAIKTPDVSGNFYQIGGGFVTSMKLTGGLGNVVTYSGKISGSGPLTSVKVS